MKTLPLLFQVRNAQFRFKLANPLRTIAVLAAACLLIGWGSSWEELKSAAGSVTSLSADFVQEKHMKILAHPLVSSGVFYFQSPASLRWEYRAPVRNILLMHDNRTERYVETGNGLTKETGAGLQAMQIVLEQISQWLGGRFDENPMFAANLEPGPKIVLVPKEKAFSRMIHHIDLVLSERPGIIDSVVIYESEDSFTKLVFKNAVLNQPIDEALFRKIS
ncbi:MAG: outer membrane lipoprotein carrier protein LolA [Desulfobacterales bacterium]